MMNTGIVHFEAFIITAFLFIASPGIDTMFIINKSLTQGKIAGVFSTFGINVGVFIHTFFAAVGLSWVLAQSAMAFMIVKYLGAAYLIYLGIKSILAKGSEDDNVALSNVEMKRRKHFTSGIMTTLFNPKVALFFLSFFPQFIAPSAVEDKMPFLLLGVVYAGIAILWFLLLTFLASTFSSKIQGNSTVKKWMNKGAGVVFILMGLKVAFSKK
ncbi:LysE family translocator [Flammeovirga aprica]|nr:LysE family translocator [Flammeovirga aprica]